MDGSDKNLEEPPIQVDTGVALSDRLDELLAALLANPKLAYLPERQLAERYHLPTELISEAIRLSSKNRHSTRKRTFSIRRFAQSIREKLMPVRNRMENQAGLSLCITFLLASIGIGCMFLANVIPDGGGIGPAVQGFIIFIGVMLLLGAFFGQMLVLLFVAKARYGWALSAIWTALLFTVAVPTLVATSAPSIEKSGHSIAYVVAATGLGFGVVGIFFGCFNSAVCILGTFLRVASQEKQEMLRSRREKIARLLELQALTEDRPYPPTKPLNPVYHLYRRFWPVSPIVIGVAIELLMIFAVRFDHLHLRALTATGSKAAPDFAVSMVGLAVDAVLVLIGTWSRTLREGALTYLAIFGTRIAFYAEGSHFGRTLTFEGTMDYLGNGLLATAFFIYIGFIIAGIQRRANYQKGLQAHDLRTLFAEVARLKLELGQVYKVVSVLAIDASQSSEMKRDQSPMLVEYSFRAYQEWIAGTCRELGGQIHSTAGDGAIIAFDDPVRAYQAAKRLQTRISTFNQTENRLPTPFRVRIGIHTGQVLGEIDSVVFTSVIDIAAHLEEAAPVGGIALSEASRQLIGNELPDERFAELSELIDHESVFLALNPIEANPDQKPNNEPDESQAVPVS